MYRLLVRPAEAWAGAVPGFKASSATYSVDVLNATGVYGSYGVLFGLSDNGSQFYTFEIDRDGYYILFRYSSGSWTIMKVGFSGSIHTGVTNNRLRLTRNGSQIQAYANGQLLANISDGSFTGLRRAGVLVTSYDEANVDARFDNFQIDPVSCPATAASGTVDWQAATDVTASGAGLGADLGETIHPRVPLAELVDE